MLLAAACSGSRASGSGGASVDDADLNDCERMRLAAALDLEIGDLSLPLDPADEPLVDIARDICSLDERDSATQGNLQASAETRQLRPTEARDATLPADLVRAPALLDPDDPPPGDEPALDELWIACGQGSASSCNALLYEAPAGSDYEAFAFSCGGRENLHCDVLLGDPSGGGLFAVDFNAETPAPGNIVELDTWWEGCGDGSSRACAELVLAAPGGSAYASFGWTCGGRTTRDCATLLGHDGDPPALAGRSPQDSPPGDDDYLDLLWTRCGDLSAPACRDLATFGPPGSDYERFALSCGWRSVTPCDVLFADLSEQAG